MAVSGQFLVAADTCSRCWLTRSEWDEWKQLEHQTIRLGDSTFEYEFLHRVLKHVKGLEPYYIRVQHEVTGSAGRNFRLDFALLPSGGRKIAIEIDGFDKTSAGSVATKEHQDKDSSRRNELHIAGWEVLSFTNRQVQTNSGECRREIENLLLTQHSSPERGAASVPVLPQPSVPVSATHSPGPPATVGAEGLTELLAIQFGEGAGQAVCSLGLAHSCSGGRDCGWSSVGGERYGNGSGVSSERVELQRGRTG